MKKQIVLFLMAMLPVVAWADASGTCGNNLTWTYEEATQTLTITGEGEMTDYKNMQLFGKTPWYTWSQSIRTLVIHDGVTSIGDEAFRECSGLTSITIPISVTSIGRGAFYNCTSLTSVHISDLTAWCRITISGEGNDYYSNPLFYAHHLFLNGEEIKDLVIPDGVTSIGDYTFLYCTGLTSITIPSSVTSIGNAAFKYCNSLTSITIPDGVTSIGDGAFYNCTDLTSITIPSSVTSIGNAAFEYCNSLTSITIPDGVTSIRDHAFSSCIGLTSITIPESVTSIGEDAFSNCTGLTSITIPNGVTSIGDQAFYNCTGLTSITIPNNVTSIGDAAFFGCTGLSSITIPDAVTSIKRSAFSGCKGLTSITIPFGVTSIGDYAFSSCSGLTSITIPESVTSIGEDAFSNCSGLTSITIPNGVTSIGDGAFYNCTDLSSITIPNSVKSIGDVAFRNCNLTTIIVEEGNEKYDSRDGCNAIIETASNTLIVGGIRTVIPNSVTTIGEYAFGGCSGLSTITIPEGVTTIKSNAFYSLNLKSITLPSTLTTIMINAFSDARYAASDVYCYAKKVDYTNGSAFDANVLKATLHVPASAMEYYCTTAPWSRFRSIVALDGGNEPELKVCAKPTIYYANGKLSFKSATEGVQFVSEISDADVKKNYTAEVDLSVTYAISVYATKEGYKDSEVATATLCWIEVEPQKEGITEDDADAVTQVKAVPVMIQAEGNALVINGAPTGTPITIYDLSGRLIHSATAQAESTRVAVGSVNDIVIVKIGERCVKVAIK